MLAALGACALAALTAVPAHAAGFAIFEQGAKAQGMAGAFTAQADDPSMLFFNPGGLGLVGKSDFSLGLTEVHGTKADFHGAAPFPGPNASGQQKLLEQPLPHAYWVLPITNTWKFGIGLNTPFGLTTEWKNPDQFPGRYLSTKAAIRDIDVNPTLGWQITPTMGLGIGVIARVTDLELKRDIPAADPFTQSIVNVGRVDLKADTKTGYGWDIGFLDRYNNSFSWGVAYRSRVKVDYTGSATLTQLPTGNPQFDAIVAAQTPFNQKLPVKTSIDFPDMANLGLAFGLSPDLLLETDVYWMGWTSFKEVNITFPDGQLPNSTIPANWKNAYSYRAGLRWTTSPTSQWRFGYVYDQTPQPEEAVNPLLPDANRNGLTLGYGWTGAHKFDIALLYLDFAKRSRHKTFAGDATFSGTYDTKALLLGATFTW